MRCGTGDLAVFYYFYCNRPSLGAHKEVTYRRFIGPLNRKRTKKSRGPLDEPEYEVGRVPSLFFVFFIPADLEHHQPHDQPLLSSRILYYIMRLMMRMMTAFLSAARPGFYLSFFFYVVPGRGCADRIVPWAGHFLQYFIIFFMARPMSPAVSLFIYMCFY